MEEGLLVLEVEVRWIVLESFGLIVESMLPLCLLACVECGSAAQPQRLLPTPTSAAQPQRLLPSLFFLSLFGLLALEFVFVFDIRESSAGIRCQPPKHNAPIH